MNYIAFHSTAIGYGVSVAVKLSWVDRISAPLINERHRSAYYTAQQVEIQTGHIIFSFHNY